LQRREEKGCMEQVGNWVFIAFFCTARGWRCLWKKKCLFGQLSPFGTSCSPSFIIIT
jgi:hypothetical protein